MGKIRVKEVKDAARALLEAFPDRFSSDVEKNKKEIEELKVAEYKSMRNKIAGYIVRLVRQKKR